MVTSVLECCWDDCVNDDGLTMWEPIVHFGIVIDLDISDSIILTELIRSCHQGQMVARSIWFTVTTFAFIVHEYRPWFGIGDSNCCPWTRNCQSAQFIILCWLRPCPLYMRRAIIILVTSIEILASCSLRLISDIEIGSNYSHIMVIKWPSNPLDHPITSSKWKNFLIRPGYNSHHPIAAVYLIWFVCNPDWLVLDPIWATFQPQI